MSKLSEITDEMRKKVLGRTPLMPQIPLDKAPRMNMTVPCPYCERMIPVSIFLTGLELKIAVPAPDKRGELKFGQPLS